MKNPKILSATLGIISLTSISALSATLVTSCNDTNSNEITGPKIKVNSIGTVSSLAETEDYNQKPQNYVEYDYATQKSDKDNEINIYTGTTTKEINNGSREINNQFVKVNLETDAKKVFNETALENLGFKFSSLEVNKPILPIILSWDCNLVDGWDFKSHNNTATLSNNETGIIGKNGRSVILKAILTQMQDDKILEETISIKVNFTAGKNPNQK